MSKRPDKNMIVGLDIGTSKVVAIVGEMNEEGNIEVVGIGSHPSRVSRKASSSTLSQLCKRDSVP